MRDVRMSFLFRVAIVWTFQSVVRSPSFARVDSFSQQQANSPSRASMRLDEDFDKLTFLERDLFIIRCLVVLGDRPNIIIVFKHLWREGDQFNWRSGINNPWPFLLQHVFMLMRICAGLNAVCTWKSEYANYQHTLHITALVWEKRHVITRSDCAALRH